MKRYAIQLTLHFEMESDTEDAPGSDETIKEIRKRIPALENLELEFEYV